MPKTNDDRPAWLKRALDPRTPTYTSSYMDDPATINTASTYREELGGEILFPTIREVKGVLKKYSIDEAEKIALKEKDYMFFKGDPETARNQATQASIELSDMVADARQRYNKGGLNTMGYAETPKVRRERLLAKEAELLQKYENAKTESEEAAREKALKDFYYMHEEELSIEQVPPSTRRYKNVFERERSNLLESEGKSIIHTLRSGEKEADRFAQGGDIVSSDDQMDMLGLVEEPNDVDPVSGNEIPLGATAEGVRDDQVAALSAGEFVIPDYAVRYHGLDFYMDSLQVAKDGLSQMDQMGMTGKPDEATISDDTPLPTTDTGMDELEKLSSVNQKPEIVANRGAAILASPVLNYANGGVVPAQVGGLQQVGLYNQPYANVAPATITDSMLQAPATTSAGITQAYPPIARPIAQPIPEAAPREVGITPYEDYGPPTQIKAYRNPETGHVIYIPETFYGDPLQQPPAGYEKVDKITTPVTPPVTSLPPTPTPIDETEQMLQMEAEAEAETAQQEEEQKAQIQERVNAVNEALVGDPTGTYMEAAGDVFNVDKKYGMFIDGVFTTDARKLKDHAHRGSRSVITSLKGAKKVVSNFVEFIKDTSIPRAVVQAARNILSSVVDDDDDAVDETSKREALGKDQDPYGLSGVDKARLEREEQSRRDKVEAKLHGERALADVMEERAEELERRGEKETFGAKEIEEARKLGVAEYLSTGGLVKKPTRKRTRKKNGKGLARSK